MRWSSGHWPQLWHGVSIQQQRVTTDGQWWQCAECPGSPVLNPSHPSPCSIMPAPTPRRLEGILLHDWLRKSALWLAESFLAKHMLTHSDQRSHMCEFCPSTFKTLSSQQKLERLLHTDKFSKKYLTGHMKRNHSDKPPEHLICDICSKVLLSKTGLRQHLASVHGDIRLGCPKCAKSYKPRNAFTAHYVCSLRWEKFLQP